MNNMASANSAFLSQPRSRKFALAVFGVIFVSALAGCKEERPPPPIRPVLSVVVADKAAATSSFAGTVEPRYQTDLGFRTPGRIITRSVDVGSIVKKGEVLASLDPVTLEFAVRTAEADLATAQARLKNSSDREARQNKLVEDKVLSRAEFETAEQAREAAGSSATRAEADLAKAREQLDDGSIIAETDGVITAVGAEVGQNVNTGQSVVTLAQPNAIDAVVDVPDVASGALRVGAAFKVALQIDPTIVADGVVREIAPQADAVTRNKRMKITLKNPSPSFRLGTTITASTTAIRSAGLELPATAILKRDGQTMIWIVDPKTSTVALSDVVIRDESGGAVIVTQGIEAGTRVVIAGVNSLEAGQQVKIDKGSPR